MALEAVFQQFVKQCPITVMDRIVLERAISAEWVNHVFDRHRQR